MNRRALTLLSALAIDAALGEPPNAVHPVVGIGALLESGHRRLRRMPVRAQLIGGGTVLASVSLSAVGVAVATERTLRRRRMGALLLGVLLKTTFSMRQLLTEANAVARLLERDAHADARIRLRSLVSRPVDALDAPLIASAAIESVAENLADSLVAPLLYFAWFGLPGAVAYRVVNTADAMYGYHGDNEWLGKSAARADDLLSWLPSRLAALVLVMAVVVTRGPRAGAAAITRWRCDARLTESPNAGHPMAVMSGALGRRFEKRGHYVLGAMHSPPTPADIRMASVLAAVAAALFSSGTLAVLLSRRER